MGDAECFNCSKPTTEGEYTIVLPDGRMIREKTLCEPCATAFREERWMALHAEPVLVRGDDERE